MKCHDAKHHLDLFMDGELSVPENLKVLEHLNLCRPCAGIYEGEKALRSVLRARLGSGTAPEGLAEKLTAAISEVPVAATLPIARFARRRLMSVAAAAGFFIVMLALVFTTPAEMPKALAYDLTSKHKELKDYCARHEDNCACLCDRCTLEPQNVQRKFFAEHGNRDACLHDLSDLGYKPLGVEVFSHLDRPVCWTVNRDDAGHTISHGLVTTKIAKQPGPLYLCDGVDRPVVMIPVAGTDKTCVFVFDSESEAKRFREARKLK